MPTDHRSSDPGTPPVRRLWQKCAQLDYLEAFLVCLLDVPPDGGWTDSTIAAAITQRFPGRKWGTRAAAVQRAAHKFNLWPLMKEASSDLRTLTPPEVDRVVKYLHELSKGTWGAGQIVKQARADGILLSYHVTRASIKRLGLRGTVLGRAVLKPTPGLCPDAERATNVGLLLKLVRTLQQPAPFPERWTITQLACACQATEAAVVETLTAHKLTEYHRKLIDRALWSTPREILEFVHGRQQAGTRSTVKGIVAEFSQAGHKVQRTEVEWALRVLKQRQDSSLAVSDQSVPVTAPARKAPTDESATTGSK